MNNRFVYANLGMSSSPVMDIVELVCNSMRQEALLGGGTPEILAAKGAALEETRVMTAKLINCNEDEVVITGNTTEGVNLIASGFDFEEGDEIITTDQEHYSCLVPWDLQRKERNIRLVEVQISSCLDTEGNLLEEVFLKELMSKITPRTKMVFVSHVLYTTGVELPIAKLCSLLRPLGIASCIDGAQAVGHLPVQMKELDCDFYAFTGGKWINGPTGTGILYIRSGGHHRLTQKTGGWASVMCSENIMYWESARRFEMSTRNVPLYRGLKKAMELFMNAMQEEEHRYLVAANRIRAHMATIPDLRLISPKSTNGILVFQSSQFPYKDLFQYFFQRGIVGRCIDQEQAVRLTIPPFLSQDDENYVIQVLDEVFSTTCID